MADDFVRNKLEDWQLQELIATFEGEGIDKEAFDLLQESDVEKIVSKTGLRIKFFAKLKSYREEQESIINAEEKKSDSTTSTLSLTDADFEELYFEVDQNGTLLSKSAELMPPPPPPMPTVAPLYCASLPSDIFPEGLESVFKNNFEGRTALLKTNVDNSCRKVITTVVVDHLLKIYTNNRIPSHAFIKAAEEIVKLFPTEKSSTYFIPYRPLYIKQGIIYILTSMSYQSSEE